MNKCQFCQYYNVNEHRCPLNGWGGSDCQKAIENMIRFQRASNRTVVVKKNRRRH